MLYIAGLLAVFVLLSVYLYYRGEYLQRDLKSAQRLTKQAQKEQQALLNVTLLAANKQQDLFKYRIDALYKLVGENSKQADSLKAVMYMANQYANVYRELLKGQHNIKAVYKKSFGDTGNKYFTAVEDLLKQQEKSHRAMWQSKDPCVLMTLLEGMISRQQLIATEEQQKTA